MRGHIYRQTLGSPVATRTKRLARPRPLYSPLTATGSTRSAPSSPDRRRRTSPPASLSRPPSTPPPFPSRAARSPPATAAPSPNRYILPSLVTSTVWLKPPAAATMVAPTPPPRSAPLASPVRPRLFPLFSPTPSACDVFGVGGGGGGARETISRGTAHPPASARRARARDTSRSRESGTNVCCWRVSCLPVEVVVVVGVGGKGLALETGVKPSSREVH